MSRVGTAVPPTAVIKPRACSRARRHCLFLPACVRSRSLLADLELARHPVAGRIWARIQHHKRPEPALELSS